MPRYFLIFVLLLVLVSAAPVSAANKASGASDVLHAGGLACFSIRPPDAPTNGAAGPRFPPHPPATYQSCDELCAAKGAACTATTGTRNPPYACDATDYDPASTLCRCCAAELH